MKTIYSLQEFRTEVLKIASEVGQEYVNVRAGIENDGKVKFSCYISGYNWNEGDTMEECLQNMQNNIKPPEIKNIDVEIEMPTTENQPS